MRRAGSITKEIGADLGEDEVRAALFLIDSGFDVKFLRANRVAGSKTPDVEIDGVKWEIKTPRKNGKYTFEHLIRTGLKQSENLIFDLRRLKASEANAITKLLKQFEMTKSWKRLSVITKTKGLLTYDK